MKPSPQVEAKTAAGTGAAGVVTLVLLLNTWQHWFTPPPPDVTAALVAAISGVTAYFAPHTPRSGADVPALFTLPPDTTVTHWGPVTSKRDAAPSEAGTPPGAGTGAPADARPTGVVPPPAVEPTATGTVPPPATTTGPMS